MHSLYKLQGVVQHYGWGGSQFIPELIGQENGVQKPFAEYWLGAHPAAPSQIMNGENLSLNEAIQLAPEHFLGNRVKASFGALPYLFKILDVKQMLSIQVHPSLESAKKGFADENEKSIPVSAPHRNYKDQNHKPELMAALSDFWLLHGFKSEEGIENIFAEVPELSGLRSEFKGGNYKKLYEAVMTMPQQQVDKILSPLVQRIMPLYDAGKLTKSSEHFWAVRAVKTFCRDGHYDRGIFSIYFFNLLHLEEGEGIYQPAGLPHAYLEGQNVEIMANSDNVLRAGLTDKHIDVPELMKHVKFAPTIPQIIPARKEGEQVYETPAAEFELTRLSLSGAASFISESATIVFIYTGSIVAGTAEKHLELKSGEAALIAAGHNFTIKPADGVATVFIVTTPKGKK